MESLPTIDIIVLVGYLAVVVGWGCWFGSGNESADRFMSAGRGLPGWVVGLSIFGSYVSSISFLAYPGKAYSSNWNALAFSLSLPLAAWAASRWFVPFYRHSGEVSAYLHLEHRFGAWARTYGVVCYMLTQLGRLGVILYLLAAALKPLVGLELSTIIIISGIVITVYPFFGGSEGVIWTGAVQSIVLVLGVVVCVIVPALGVTGGPVEIVHQAASADKFSLGSFSSSLSEPTFWVILVYGLASNLQNFGIDQSYVQRYITAKNDRAASNSVWMGSLGYVPLSAALLFIGTALWAFYRVHPAELPEGVKGDMVFPHFISTQLPPGLMGLVLAAICSAAMDSNLNCCATLYLCDIHLRYVRPQAGNAESLWVLRAAVLIMGAFCTLTALAIIGVASALDIWWMLASVLGGGTLGLFLLGLFVKRANGRAAAVATVLNFVVIVWMAISLSPRLSWLLPESLLYTGNSNLPIVFGTLLLLISGIVLSFFAPFRRDPVEADVVPAIEPSVAAST
ncbi:MAG TPA: sodium/solute symporter [Planctomycetaceae bacterium]|nr:sodium/solute symporter [Planctomycetaceae bacterium]